MDLELDPSWQTSAGCQACEAHRFLSVSRAARIWQKQELFRVDKVQNIGERVVLAGEVGPPQSHRDDFGSARGRRKFVASSNRAALFFLTSAPPRQIQCFPTKLSFNCAICSFSKTLSTGSNRSPSAIARSATLNRSVRKDF